VCPIFYGLTQVQMLQQYSIPNLSIDPFIYKEAVLGDSIQVLLQMVLEAGDSRYGLRWRILINFKPLLSVSSLRVLSIND